MDEKSSVITPGQGNDPGYVPYEEVKPNEFGKAPEPKPYKGDGPANTIRLIIIAALVVVVVSLLFLIAWGVSSVESSGWKNLKDFIADNWKWLLLIGLIGLILWLIYRFRSTALSLKAPSVSWKWLIWSIVGLGAILLIVYWMTRDKVVEVKENDLTASVNVSSVPSHKTAFLIEDEYFHFEEGVRYKVLYIKEVYDDKGNPKSIYSLNLDGSNPGSLAIMPRDSYAGIQLTHRINGEEEIAWSIGYESVLGFLKTVYIDFPKDPASENAIYTITPNRSFDARVVIWPDF